MNGDKRRRFRLTDFMPRWSRRRQSPAQMLEALRGLAARQEHLGNNR